MVSPVAYCLSVAFAAATCAILCVAARRHPGRWTVVASRGIGLILTADAASWTIALLVRGTWSLETSLPLALCNMAVLVAAAACWWQTPVLVEVTWFWGLTGTLQAVLTPDLDVSFPHLVFFQYVVGHTAIVLAAMFLVVGLRNYPRRGAVPRVLAITAGYTALVGFVDAITGADYMFLRSPPENWTLLRVLGPWPWYIASAAGVGVVLFTLLDAPFWANRRHHNIGGPRARAGPPQALGATRGLSRQA